MSLFTPRTSAAFECSMSGDVPPERLELESQLMSIMDVLVRAAVTEISQLVSESSASVRLQLSQSLKDNEALRSRMKTMRSELFSLRLQTRTSRPSSRFSPIRGHVPKGRVKTQTAGGCFYFEKNKNKQKNNNKTPKLLTASTRASYVLFHFSCCCICERGLRDLRQ